MVLLESEQVPGGEGAGGGRVWALGGLGRGPGPGPGPLARCAPPGEAPLCCLLLQFLTELTRLFQKCRTSGSVFITLKKCERGRGTGGGAGRAPRGCRVPADGREGLGEGGGSREGGRSLRHAEQGGFLVTKR